MPWSLTVRVGAGPLLLLSIGEDGLSRFLARPPSSIRLSSTSAAAVAAAPRSSLVFSAKSSATRLSTADRTQWPHPRPASSREAPVPTEVRGTGCTTSSSARCAAAISDSSASTSSSSVFLWRNRRRPLALLVEQALLLDPLVVHVERCLVGAKRMLSAVGALLDREHGHGRVDATLAQVHLHLFRLEPEAQQSGDLLVAAAKAQIRNLVPDELADGFLAVPPHGMLGPWNGNLGPDPRVRRERKQSTASSSAAMVSAMVACTSTQQRNVSQESSSSFSSAPFLLNLSRSWAERMSEPFTLSSHTMGHLRSG